MANDRRAAKEAYLAALKLQVTADDLSSRHDKLQPNYNDVREPIQVSERDRILDERHSEFLRKQDRTLHRTAQESHQPVDDLYRNQTDTSYRSGTSIKSHQDEGSKVGWESRKPQQNFDPGAWKREGYPSEYAYAQSNGALDIPSSKDRNSHEYNYDRLSESAIRRDYSDQVMDYEGSGGSYVAPVGSVREQVREQVQGLSYPNHRDYQTQQHRGTEPSTIESPVHKALRGGISAIGNDNDRDKDKLAKKAKQAEYAQYLESQMQAREQRNSAEKRGQNAKNGVNGPSYEGLGLQNMGIVNEDKSAKRNKQAEYARDLQQQQQQQQRVNQEDTHRTQRSDRPYQQQEREEQQRYDDRRQSNNDYDCQQQLNQDNRNVYGNGIRVEERRNISPQRERARNSQYDDYSYGNDVPQRYGDSRYIEEEVDSRGQGQGARVTVPSAMDSKREEIAAKRAKQLEYARSLSDQQQFKQRRHQDNGHNSSDSNHHSAPSSSSSGGYANSSNQNNRSVDEVTEKQMKRAKQAEYAQALQRQQLMQQSATSSSSSSAGNRGSHSPGKKSHNREREVEGGPSRLSGQNGSGGLEDGWVIGPLGQPVRRTLEVGHRGVQKVFNQTKKEQNQIDSPSYGRGGEGGGRDRDGSEGYYAEGGNDGGSLSHDSPSSFSDQRYREGQGQRGLGPAQGQGRDSERESGKERERGYERNPYVDEGSYDSQDYRHVDDDPHTYHGDNGNGGGGGGGSDTMGLREKGNFKAHNIEPRTALDADVLDERKLKAKNMQAEQGRALQIQMKEKEKRLASEKEKRGKEELLELTRLEVERVAMVKAFEREQQEGRKKADDDNKKALLHQAGEKKRAKEVEDLKEQEMNEREDRKVREEQEAVRRREMAELQRERNPSKGMGVGMEGSGSKGSRANLFKQSPSTSPSSSPSKPLDTSGRPRGGERGREKEGSGESQWQAPSRHPSISSPSSSSSPSKNISHGDGNRNGNRDRNGVNEMERSMRGVSMKELHSDRDRDNNYSDEDRYANRGHSAGSSSQGHRSRSELQEGRESYGHIDRGSQRERDKEKEWERMRERERVGLGGGNGSLVRPHTPSVWDNAVPVATAWERPGVRDGNRYRDRGYDRNNNNSSSSGYDHGANGGGRRSALDLDMDADRDSSRRNGGSLSVRESISSRLDVTLNSDSRFVFPDGTAFVSLNPADRERDRDSGGAVRYPLKSSEESNRRSSSAGAGRMKGLGLDGRGLGSGVGSDGREKPRTPYLDLRGVQHSHDTDTESVMETGSVGVAALSPRIAARMVPPGTDRSWGVGKGIIPRGNTRSPMGGGEAALVSNKTAIERVPSAMQEREKGRERGGAVSLYNHVSPKGVSPSLTRNNSNSSSHANPYEDDFEILDGDDDDLEVEVGEDSEVMWAESDDPDFDIDAVLRKNRRKYNILEKYGHDEVGEESGGVGVSSSTHLRGSANHHDGEELDMLIENLNGASSRPSTTSSSRPASSMPQKSHSFLSLVPSVRNIFQRRNSGAVEANKPGSTDRSTRSVFAAAGLSVVDKDNSHLSQSPSSAF